MAEDEKERESSEEFNHSAYYLEDDFNGNLAEIPAKLALNNPIGRQPRQLTPHELPWACDRWNMDNSGDLIMDKAELKKLDQYQPNFWKSREKNLKRDEDRIVAKELVIKRAEEIRQRLENRKRDRSEDASRTLALHKKGRVDTEIRDQEGLDTKEVGIT